MVGDKVSKYYFTHDIVFTGLCIYAVKTLPIYQTKVQDQLPQQTCAKLYLGRLKAVRL